MKEYKLPILFSLISIIGVYLCGSFFELDFDPRNWGAFTSGTVSILFFMCPLCIMINKAL